MSMQLTELKERIVACCQRTCPCFREKPEPVRDVKVIGTQPTLQVSPVSPPLPAAPPPPAARVYTALWDYTARTTEDLSFRAGDQLEVLDQSSPDWWIARLLTGTSAHSQGYIPSNYVAPLESLHAERWYFPNTKRLDAEKLLQAEGNEHGSFLIRECESQQGDLSLSVLDQEKVKHYKIKRTDNGRYFVSKKRSFITLKELVEHYSGTEDGLCVRLTQPCRKAIAPQTHGLSYNTADQWEIPRSSIRLLHKLGSGQFGEVYEGVWNNTTAVAVKTLRPGNMDSQDFLREAQLMKKLRHPKLIQLYAVCTVGEPIYIITELMNNGSLLEYLQKDRGEFVKLCDQIEMGAQVAAGMAYLELQNYIHRDLAARNVLVGDNNICKVADFGLARVFKAEDDVVYDYENDDEECVYEVRHGTKLPVKWTAPEVLHENKFTIKSDVWSFGILLYEIMTFGQMPYPTLSNHQVFQKLRKSYRMPCPANSPKRIYDIMLECWKDTPLDRPTFETLQWKLEEFYEMDISAYDDASRY
ncbi:tyrosine-protein kinase SRK2 [Neoarius graeffei]|uniref:tyrosine-protein kinase SRK2 n=1 Tax=Neoarius graeffei TaxID=443677 RepID=UPI00298CB3B9|nr:tyrosine-protein kinase SRK2 [Neoarius graeffei]